VQPYFLPLRFFVDAGFRIGSEAFRFGGSLRSRLIALHLDRHHFRNIDGGNNRLRAKGRRFADPPGLLVQVG